MSINKIKIKRLREQAKFPVKATDGAAGADVYIAKIEVDCHLVTCYLGFATEMPEFYHALMIARSNLTKYGWVLANGIGLIDSDFRGEWVAKFAPLPGAKAFPYGVGDRCAQIIFNETLLYDFEETSVLNDTKRGSEGFGTTGLK